MDVNIAASYFLVGGFTVLILCAGLYLVSVANVSLSVRELVFHPTFLLSRPVFELNLCVLSWFLMGWALANGGDIGLFLGTSEFVTIGIDSYALWFYQLTLLLVSCVIFSNATLSRIINGHSRFVSVLLFSLVIFPVLYHWVYSVWGWASPYRYQIDTYR